MAASRATMPAFDADPTPTASMGRIADTARSSPGAGAAPIRRIRSVRSVPTQQVTGGHAPSKDSDDASPLARLYDLDADILLLGVGHANNTSLHLAEHRSGTRGLRCEGSPLLVDGERQWVTYDVLDTYTEDFEDLGRAAGVVGPGTVRSGGIGSRPGCFPSAPLVDFATDWFVRNRADQEQRAETHPQPEPISPPIREPTDRARSGGTIRRSRRAPRMTVRRRAGS